MHHLNLLKFQPFEFQTLKCWQYFGAFQPIFQVIFQNRLKQLGTKLENSSIIKGVTPLVSYSMYQSIAHLPEPNV